VTDQQTTIPTLTTAADATALLEQLAADNEWVSVFWDRGWGDSGQKTEITIIVDGDGQHPKAHITADVYQALLNAGIIQPNSLNTFKARRLHDYKTPPEPEPTVNPGKTAETVIRDIVFSTPDTPIVARFFRGIQQDAYGPQVAEETTSTPAAKAGWFVLLLPGCTDVALSAQKPGFGGHDIIGGGPASCLAYPTTDDGGVDVEALAGAEFRARLVAAINEKATVVAAEFEKVNAGQNVYPRV
jgi:hypothetical protein